MAGTAERTVMKNVIDLSAIPCPSCGRSDRWDVIRTRVSETNNPQLIVWCDCGIGELQIIVE